MGNNTLKVKKTPERQCLGCNEHKPKRVLVRVVRLPDGECVLDLKGKVSGRGAYICSDENCAKKLQKAKLLDRVFAMTVPSEVYTAIEEALIATK